MSKEKPFIIYDADLNPLAYKTKVDVDLSDLFDPAKKKELVSSRIDWNGRTLWLAEHNIRGRYWTTNTRDPKILNLRAINSVTGEYEARPRGSIAFATGELGRTSGGRTKGAVSRQSVAQACANMNVQPAAFLAAVVSGNIGVLKQYRVKDPHNIPLSVKVKVAEVLLNKLQGNARPVDVDAYGEPIDMKALNAGDASKPQLQVYIPSTKQKATIPVTHQEAEEIEQSGIEAYLEKHKDALEITDEEIEGASETMEWKLG